MEIKNYYEGIQHIVFISSNIGTHCEHCGTPIGMDNFAIKSKFCCKFHPPVNQLAT
jgi:hypothetical protein